MFDSPLFGRSLRQPPQNLEAEEALLGAALHNNKTIDRCPGLRPEHFAHKINGRVFAEISKALLEDRLADAVSLKGVLEGSGLFTKPGDISAYLARLMASMVGIINAAEYSRCIIDASIRRVLIDKVEGIYLQAIGDDPDHDTRSILRNAVSSLEEIGDGSFLGDEFVSLNDAVDSAIDAMKAASDGSSGLSTGFHSLDKRLGGLEPGLVYVIAGRPGMGKSAIGHQIAINIAKTGVGVLELSLEMSAQQLGRRALSTVSEIPIMAIKRGDPERDTELASRIVAAQSELRNLPLSIDATAGQTASEIAEKVRIYRRKHGLGFIMIDHLNLMRPEKEDAKHGATWVIERASGTVLEIAKSCNVPVLLLAQLNRGVEGREDKRPSLSDLRQAGAIEQDAYAVGFVYRGEYYMTGEPEPRDSERDTTFQERRQAWFQRKDSLKGVAEMIWSKVRDGEPGSDNLLFHALTASFSEDGQGHV